MKEIEREKSEGGKGRERERGREEKGEREGEREGERGGGGEGSKRRGRCILYTQHKRIMCADIAT